MIDALIRWSLGHRPVVVALAAAFLVWGGWTAITDSSRCVAGSHRPDGHDPGRSARHGPARDRVAGDVPHRVGAERGRGRTPGALGDRCRRRRRVGRVRLGPGHRPGAANGDGEAHARVRLAAAERRAAVPRARVVDHGRSALRRSRVGSPFALGTAHRRRDGRSPAPARRSRRVAGDRDRRRAEAIRGRARPRASGGPPGDAPGSGNGADDARTGMRRPGFRSPKARSTWCAASDDLATPRRSPR